MFIPEGHNLKPSFSKIWLASPTKYGFELEYMKEAYETNWMSTVGKNINEVERIAAEKASVKFAVGLSCCTAALHLCVKLAGRDSTESRIYRTERWKASGCSARI